MKPRGLVIISVAIAIPLIWSIPLMTQMKAEGVISQYLGIVALILMGIAQFQATRIPLVETLFGSLDRVYVQHKWLGVGAVVTAYLHDLTFSEAGEIVLSPAITDTAEDIGELALNGLLVLVAISLITIIPYKYWKWSHRFIGVFYALAAFHYIFVAKPYSTLDIEGLYVAFFCVLGVLSYIYLLIPRMIGHNSSPYTVTSVVHHNDITEINLAPNGHSGISYEAGQFAFINYTPLKLREVHPFTISSAPKDDGSLRFMIKDLGDYTKVLRSDLKGNTAARISGGYGHFSLKPTNSAQVWIGGGIGITPFLAWAQALTGSWSDPAHLYYCVRNSSDALYIEEFESAAARTDQFRFSLMASKEGNRLNADRIVANLNEIGQDVATTHFYFCGPEKMRDALRSDLAKRGMPSSNFHYEKFEMRAGLGIIPFVRRFTG